MGLWESICSGQKSVFTIHEGMYLLQKEEEGGENVSGF